MMRFSFTFSLVAGAFIALVISVGNIDAFFLTVIRQRLEGVNPFHAVTESDGAIGSNDFQPHPPEIPPPSDLLDIKQNDEGVNPFFLTVTDAGVANAEEPIRADVDAHIDSEAITIAPIEPPLKSLASLDANTLEGVSKAAGQNQVEEPIPPIEPQLEALDMDMPDDLSKATATASNELQAGLAIVSESIVDELIVSTKWNHLFDFSLILDHRCNSQM